MKIVQVSIMFWISFSFFAYIMSFSMHHTKYIQSILNEKCYGYTCFYTYSNLFLTPVTSSRIMYKIASIYYFIKCSTN